MASTNSTANLDLSQFVGTDKPDWLTDYNGDMEKIDAAYGAVNATAEEAAANAESAAASASQAATDAAEALAGISGAIEAAAAAQTAAEQATSVSTSALTVANGAAATAQSAAGDASQALQVANNAKVTAENAQAAAAQSATSAAASAASAAQAATDAASAAAIASGVDTRVTAIEACVPSGASSSDKFALESDIAAASGSVYETLDTSAENCITPNENENWTSFFSRLAAKIDFTKLTENSRIVKAYRFNGEWRYLCYRLRTYQYVNAKRDAVFMALNGTIASSAAASSVYNYIMHIREDGLGDDGYIGFPGSGQANYSRSADTAVVGTYYSFFIFY